MMKIFPVIHIDNGIYVKLKRVYTYQYIVRIEIIYFLLQVASNNSTVGCSVDDDGLVLTPEEIEWYLNSEMEFPNSVSDALQATNDENVMGRKLHWVENLGDCGYLAVQEGAREIGLYMPSVKEMREALTAYFITMESTEKKKFYQYDLGYYNIYRASNIDYLDEVNAHLEAYKDKPFSYWRDKISANYPNNKEWIDELGMKALAEVYNVMIVVFFYHRVTKKTVLLHTYGSNNAKKIYLLNDFNQHYWALLKTATTSALSPSSSTS